MTNTTPQPENLGLFDFLGLFKKECKNVRNLDLKFLDREIQALEKLRDDEKYRSFMIDFCDYLKGENGSANCISLEAHDRPYSLFINTILEHGRNLHKLKEELVEFEKDNNKIMEKVEKCGRTAMIMGHKLINSEKQNKELKEQVEKCEKENKELKEELISCKKENELLKEKLEKCR